MITARIHEPDLADILSPRGRINRATYLLYSLTFLPLERLFQGIASSDTSWLELLGIAVALPLIWLWACLTIKRLHDLNLSGWWCLALLLFPVTSAGAMVLIYFLEAGSVIPVLLAVIAGIPVLLAYILLTFVKGTVGDNRFGPDPLA
ncbi:DUF805 domain-containing protein [Asticcacaulis sp. BYS171W]|uniref:DUF805 domain-containing protein n=1 Tax=Asticcacaulis aquaticus TaxID=2984212 RepID=A0ABT5HR09_9CAUL|nr:DUF805 domain-containing protein [Asticcacaulis aquaticus]